MCKLCANTPNTWILNRIEQFTPTPKYSLAEAYLFKKKKGVYFIFDRKDKLIYIGQTKDLYARFYAHTKIDVGLAKDFLSFDFFEMPCNCMRFREARLTVEKSYINFFRPIHNRTMKKNINLCEVKE